MCVGTQVLCIWAQTYKTSTMSMNKLDILNTDVSSHPYNVGQDLLVTLAACAIPSPHYVITSAHRERMVGLKSVRSACMWHTAYHILTYYYEYK